MLVQHLKIILIYHFSKLNKGEKQNKKSTRTLYQNVCLNLLWGACIKGVVPVPPLCGRAFKEDPAEDTPFKGTVGLCLACFALVAGYLVSSFHYTRDAILMRHFTTD